MDVPDLDPFFEPRSVAVVGASPDSWYSSQLVENLLTYGFEGELSFVNPGRERAWGQPCHDRLADLSSPPDLVVISVPRAAVLDVLEEAGDLGVPAALVITAGFGEADAEGEALEAELATVAAETGIRVCGPNCIGLADSRSETVLTSTCSRKPEGGSIGLVSQSGALAFTTFFERAADEDVRFSKIVSTGNEADLSLTDFVAYMHADPSIEAICAYVEGVENPRRFARVAEEATRSGTPVFVVKIGDSAAGAAASLSHTGSLTGSDAAWNALLKGAGVQRVKDVPDLLGQARAQAAFDAPEGDRVCIASTSGGLASLLADMAGAWDLSVPELSAETEAELLDVEELLTFGELHNPVDIRGYGADALPAIADALFADDFDAYVLAIGLSAVDERAEAIADDLLRIAAAAPEPVFFLWTGRKTPERDGDGAENSTARDADALPYERVRREVPLYYDAGRCMDALASLVRFGADHERVTGRPPLAEQDARSTTSSLELPPDRVLPWAEVERLCSAYGISLARTELASTPERAIEAASAIGPPVVLKSDSPAVSHRAAADAVRLGLDSGPEIEAAYEAITANVTAYDETAALEGLLVQDQVAGTEAIVGVTTEPGFGPLITVGTGGRLVEVLGDRSTRLAPLSIAEAEEMLAETRLPDLLVAESNEGGIEELRELLVAVSELASETSVAELDFNPVMVRAGGVTIVDALVRTDSVGDGDTFGDVAD
ncbi:acetyl-CoA synthetase [Halobacteriales archaeon QS_3_64_16]|nr:MAG: acetyl-CoA synthetase [Halobacteriales archaeon QS_3_64_16]